MTAFTPPSPRAGRPHYAWVVAVVTFLTLVASAGIGATRAVLVLPLEREFGWDLATVSLALSVSLLLFGVCGPFAGAFMAKFGVRRVMIAGLLTLAAATSLSVLMRAPWQLVALWGVLVGVGSGSMALVLGATVVNRWFVAARGLVMGLFTAGSATGQLVFLPMQAALVDAAGWRAAVLVASGAAVVVAVLVWALMRDDPREVGLAPYGAAGGAAPPPAPVAGNPFVAALRALLDGARSPDFRLLAGGFAICGATTVGLISMHLIPASHDHGLPEVAAAGMLAAMGVFDLIGTTVSGWLTDRVDSRKLLVWYYSLRGLSLICLPVAYALGPAALLGFVVFYGLDWVATVPPTVRLAADRFGPARVGMVFGWIFAAHQVGGALAAFGAGLMRTWLGDYTAAFTVAGGLCLIAAGLSLAVGRFDSARTAAAPALGLESAASD